MSWTSIFATYAIVWWLVLFTTLPFGVRALDVVEKCMEPGAPEKPRMWFKAGITTVIAALITAAIYSAIEYGIVDFRSVSS